MTNRDLVLEALRGHLTSTPELTALVGQRIYQDIAPQNASRPNIIYMRISRGDTQAKQGRANLIESRVQFTIAADTKALVRDISDIMRDALAEFAGPMGTSLTGVVNVVQVRTSGEVDLYDEDASVYYRHQDFVIRHRYKEDE